LPSYFLPRVPALVSCPPRPQLRSTSLPSPSCPHRPFFNIPSLSSLSCPHLIALTTPPLDLSFLPSPPYLTLLL
jgi:hypothetical protein